MKELPATIDKRQAFEAAAARPLRQRFRYAFIHTYKPVLDDASYRSEVGTLTPEQRGEIERRSPRQVSMIA